MGASAQPARSLELVRPLAFFDLETTGTDVATDHIVEIAVLKLLPDGTEQIFHTLVDPGMPIPAEATEVHGISDADVRGKPTFQQIAQVVADFLAGCDFAGFNVTRFDLPLLKAEVERAGLVWPEAVYEVIDAHVVYQEKERRDLTAAVKFYTGTEHPKAHSALADSRATKLVLEAQIRCYPDLPNNVVSLGRYCKEARPNRFADSGYWFLNNNGVLVFNKSQQHKGEPLIKVAKSDPSFLEWMLTIDVPGDTKDLVRAALVGAQQTG